MNTLLKISIIFINCEFENNGNVHISITCNNVTNIETLNMLLMLLINMSSNIKFYSESGYAFDDFKSNEPNIEIINVVKKYEINYSLPINFKNK